MTAEYRLDRISSFMDPWADPYGSGFQLVQALIALGSGEWLGVGLGASVQKLFYLPHASNDFLIAVVGEELGLVGVAALLCLYGLVLWRVFNLASRAAAAKAYFGPARAGDWSAVDRTGDVSFCGQPWTGADQRLEPAIDELWRQQHADQWAGVRLVDIHRAQPVERPRGGALTTVMIMAGGTGGHVYPALSVAEHLRDQGIEIVWLGTYKGLEARVVPAAGFQMEWLEIKGLMGSSWIRKAMMPWMLLRALIQALTITRRRMPDAVLGMGGFAAGPGGLAAWLLRRPL